MSVLRAQPVEVRFFVEGSRVRDALQYAAQSRHWNKRGFSLNPVGVRGELLDASGSDFALEYLVEDCDRQVPLSLGGLPATRTLDRGSISSGLAAMLICYTTEFVELFMRPDHIDVHHAMRCDLLLQCCLFGRRMEPWER